MRFQYFIFPNTFPSLMGFFRWKTTDVEKWYVDGKMRKKLKSTQKRKSKLDKFLRRKKEEMN